MSEEFFIRKTPTDMEIGENAIEMRYGQAFSFDFDKSRNQPRRLGGIRINKCG